MEEGGANGMIFLLISFLKHYIGGSCDFRTKIYSA
jgi:hypothetical protein